MTGTSLKGQGSIVGRKAPDFTLKSDTLHDVTLADVISKGAALLAFYPNDFTMVCTKQLCGYQESLDQFKQYGVSVFGISSNTPESHRAFAEKYKFAFSLLSDPGHEVAKLFGCTSLLMLGNVSRAVFVLNAQGIILYRYVEPTIITHRSADELIAVLSDLKANHLL